MEENKSKGKGISIAIILLAIVIGFGFVIGLTQVTGGLKEETPSEISNYAFDEEGNLLSYTGSMTDIVIPETYSFSSKSESVELSSSSIYSLVEQANRLGIREYSIKNETGNFTDDYGNVYYQEKYTLCYQKRKVIEGTDYVVKGISAQAFQNKSNITSITLPSTIEKIGSNAFSGCTRLKTINLPSGLTRIENAAFYNCRVLESIELPSTLQYIGPQAFQDCDKLESVTIPALVEYVPDMCFSNCDRLQSVTILGYKYQIGYQAFYNCRLLNTVNIPEGVNYIGNQAFYNCRALTEIELPSSITNIENQAFYNCTNLRNVTIRALNVPNVYTNTFMESYIENIYVPDESFDMYQNYGNWNYYYAKLRLLSEKENI